MPRRSVWTALVLALAFAPVHAQDAAVGSLARAQAVWSATDRDHDGKITSVEAASIPIDVVGFRRADADGDGAWSREEFLLFYRRCLLDSREPVGADLEAEVARLQALRKVRAIEEARQRASGCPVTGASDPAITAALAQLERRLDERRAQREDVARLRELIRAKLAARPIGGVPELSRARSLSATDPVAAADALLDRIERALARGEDARVDRASLRALLVQRGCIASAPAQSRIEQWTDSKASTSSPSPPPLRNSGRVP